jgi:hypothetical protein
MKLCIIGVPARCAKHQSSYTFAALTRLAGQERTMMYVVLSVGVLTFSALFMRRESRMLAHIEEYRAAHGLMS